MITRDLFKFYFKILLKFFLEESTFKYRFKTRNQVISPFFPILLRNFVKRATQIFFKKKNQVIPSSLPIKKCSNFIKIPKNELKHPLKEKGGIK